MYLPMQSEPVQRNNVGQPAASRSDRPQVRLSGIDSSNGVDPNGIFDDIWSVAGPALGGLAKTALPALLSAI